MDAIEYLRVPQGKKIELKTSDSAWIPRWASDIERARKQRQTLG